MVKLSEIRALIDAYIKTNGNQEITGHTMNVLLNEIVRILDERKQDVLVSGENIKTIGGMSLLGEGDIPGYDDTEIRNLINAVVTAVEGQNGKITEVAGSVQEQGKKLTELSAEITSHLFEMGNVLNGNEVANDVVYRSLYIPCKKGDIINGKIYRVKVFDANYKYLGEEGTTLTGALTDFVVENASCAYVRIVVLARDIDDCTIYVNGVNALYLVNKDAFNKIVSIYGEIALLKVGSCVYEISEDVLKKPILFAIKDMSITPQEGYLYTIVLRNLANASQFSLYRALESAPTSLQFVANFITTSSTQQNGRGEHSLKASTGETASVIIDWDAAKGLESGTLYPNKFILREEVFRGGLLSNNLIPQVSKIEAKVDEIEAKVDGLSVGGGSPQEIYWAVCGDSITNANHATIYDIAEGDEYMPIDGYPNLNTYKRKNYAYYIAQRNRLKWANYGWGGTTLSSVTSKAYGYKNAFVDERMTSMADVEWNYISIFFGGNDSYFGPTAWKDKWLTEKYGQELGYPVNAEQIGADGFANAEQKAACDAVVGMVNGVNYETNADYFIAKFIGTINDTSKDTWYGALNTAVSYLLANHPKAKIILVASYTPASPKYADAVIEVAERWGVRCFDFRNIPHWPVSARPNWRGLDNPNTSDGKWPLENGLMYGATVDGRNMSLYVYDGAHPTNRGYEEMSHLLEQTIIA